MISAIPIFGFVAIEVIQGRIQTLLYFGREFINSRLYEGQCACADCIIDCSSMATLVCVQQQQSWLYLGDRCAEKYFNASLSVSNISLSLPLQ